MRSGRNVRTMRFRAGLIQVRIHDLSILLWQAPAFCWLGIVRQDCNALLRREVEQFY